MRILVFFLLIIALPIRMAMPKLPRPIVTTKIEKAIPLLTASYYGKRFHGKKTANGDIFNMHELTAAHISLPFGTRLKLKNPTNNIMVTVLINDRGPYDPTKLPELVPHPERQLDLSRGAAEKLEIIEEGIADLYIENGIPPK